MQYVVMVLLSVTVLIQSCVVVQVEHDSKAVQWVLDDFHDAAASADKKRYLGHFSKKGVFMGTDDWERWPLPEFTQYVDKRFKQGTGWSYKSIERNINFSDSGETAWFDEITQSEKWGRFRGTGVLIKEAGIWKLAHYSMSVLVPNESWEETLALLKTAYEARRLKKNQSQEK